MKFEDIVEGMVLPPAKVRRLLENLKRRGEFVEESDDWTLTPKGEERLSSIVYGQPLEVLVSDAVRLREWVQHSIITAPGTAITIDSVHAGVQILSMADQKIGRVLRTLGCQRVKKSGTVSYVLPDTMKRVELRDLTRTKSRLVKAEALPRERAR